MTEDAKYYVVENFWTFEPTTAEEDVDTHFFEITTEPCLDRGGDVVTDGHVDNPWITPGWRVEVHGEFDSCEAARAKIVETLGDAGFRVSNEKHPKENEKFLVGARPRLNEEQTYRVVIGDNNNPEEFIRASSTDEEIRKVVRDLVDQAEAATELECDRDCIERALFAARDELRLEAEAEE